MRFAALVLALAVVGCKDSQPAQPQSTPTGSGKVSAPQRPSLDRPKVSGPGVVKISKVSATITFTQKDLLLDDNSLGKIHDGIIDRDKLDALTRALEPAGATADPIGIALDPKLPYLRVSQLLLALKAAGLRNLALLTGTASFAVPLELTDMDQLGSSGLRPVLTIRAGSLVLWSASGEEGTMEKPKLVGSSVSLLPLTKALAEIVQRRWPDGMRAAEDRAIVIQLAGTDTAERLLQVLAAVRSDGTLELFPTVYLAGGV